jgi:NAD(P)-dependent dehydrogenase (short-subunit alcohol dehydrogenase family)
MNDHGQVLGGRVALVTGASRGLGRALALALADAGADLVLAARSADDLESLAEEIRARGRRALAMPTDITQTVEVDRLVERAVAELGAVDVLVNNSGVYEITPLVEMSDETWDRIIDTNLRGTFLCTRAVGRFLVRRGDGGKIINIASNLGLMGRPDFAAYCASKGAVIQLTRALALEWAPLGVQVNAIAPGYVQTDFNVDVRNDPEVYAKVLRQIPARRMASPEEIAPLAVYLASPASDFVTGETIVIDGGQVAA